MATKKGPTDGKSTLEIPQIPEDITDDSLKDLSKHSYSTDLSQQPASENIVTALSKDLLALTAHPFAYTTGFLVGIFGSTRKGDAPRTAEGGYDWAEITTAAFVNAKVHCDIKNDLIYGSTLSTGQNQATPATMPKSDKNEAITSSFVPENVKEASKGPSTSIKRDSAEHLTEGEKGRSKER